MGRGWLPPSAGLGWGRALDGSGAGGPCRRCGCVPRGGGAISRCIGPRRRFACNFDDFVTKIRRRGAASASRWGYDGSAVIAYLGKRAMRAAISWSGCRKVVEIVQFFSPDVALARCWVLPPGPRRPRHLRPAGAILP